MWVHKNYENTAGKHKICTPVAQSLLISSGHSPRLGGHKQSFGGARPRNAAPVAPGLIWPHQESNHKPSLQRWTCSNSTNLIFISTLNIHSYRIWLQVRSRNRPIVSSNFQIRVVSRPGRAFRVGFGFHIDKISSLIRARHTPCVLEAIKI